MLALQHSDSCIALHTVNPDCPAPRFAVNFLEWIRYRLAKLTYALLRRPSFGYTPEELAMTELSLRSPSQQHTPPVSPGLVPDASAVPTRPQTISYAVTDSPSGLLAYVLDAIKPNAGSTAPHSSLGSSRLQLSHIQNPWSPTSLITWTMLYWLPGPEVALRWLLNTSHLTSALWSTYSNVPLGITHFRDSQAGSSATGYTPPQWAESYQRVVLRRRREGGVRIPAWERPAEVVLDIRELCAVIGRYAVRATASLGLDVE